MHVSDKQSSIDSQEELESCQLKERTTRRDFHSQVSQSSSVGSGERVVTNGYGLLEASSASYESGRGLSESGDGIESVIEEEQMAFCVGDVRKRLTQHSSAPKKMFQRDPNDPSGMCTCKREGERGR